MEILIVIVVWILGVVILGLAMEGFKSLYDENFEDDEYLEK